MDYETSDVLAGLALLVSLASAGIAAWSLSLSRRAQKTHLHPSMGCHLYRDHSNLVFVSKNVGPIPAQSVSVRLDEYQWVESQHAVMQHNTEGDLSGSWLFIMQLGPNEEVAQAVQLAPKNHPVVVRILRFSIEFYRPTDGRSYRKQCTYYIVMDQIYTANNYPDQGQLTLLEADLRRYIERTAERDARLGIRDHLQ